MSPYREAPKQPPATLWFVAASPGPAWGYRKIVVSRFFWWAWLKAKFYLLSNEWGDAYLLHVSEDGAHGLSTRLEHFPRAL